MEKFDLSLESLRTSHVVAGILLSWTTYTVYNHLHWKRYVRFRSCGNDSKCSVFLKFLDSTISPESDLLGPLAM
jgi:hypothetical protein